MFRILLLLIILAGVGAYFTKPDRAMHEAKAQATLEAAQEAAASSLDLGDMLNLGLAGLMQEGRYEDFYLASKYTVIYRGQPLMECWGAFQQVQCSPPVSGGAAEQAPAT